MPSLYALKPWYARRLRWFVDAAVRRSISPDLFTVVGIAGACCAAVSIACQWWPLTLFFLAVRLAGANLDGAVARARGVSRPWGFVLNELGDRASDLIMFAGLTVLAMRAERTGGVFWVAGAAIAATLPTFASLAAAGAGAARRNGGPVGKTERCAAAVLCTAIPAWIAPVCAVIVAGSVVTATLRLVGAHRELSEGR